ncbi:MAG: TatD family hydrolase [Proteobacteria bacterium]|nr:TatD family hydrolase [Pseudomonadota bacterium]
MPAQLVDSHCHIPMIEQQGGIDTILAAARDNGVEHMLCVCIDLDSYPDVLRLAQRYDCISASVGVHPNTEVSQEPDAEHLAELASDANVIAVGETGLDYFRSKGELDWQRDRMRVHIRAAKAVQKPLIIHSREARQDVIDILAEEGADSIGGVMHCFVDDWQTAQQAMALNFYISFSGIVTFKNARELKEVAKLVPLDRLLIETDSPYLAPVPYRGKQNQPAYVRHVAEHIAELRGESFEDIAAATSDNFSKLFNKKIN